MATRETGTDSPELGAGDSGVPDERLRLIFTRCHPALAMEARVALTLRTLTGLGTAEIARAFLVTEATMPSGSSGPSTRSPTRASPTGYRQPAPCRSRYQASLRCSTWYSTRDTRPAPGMTSSGGTCATGLSPWPRCWRNCCQKNRKPRDCSPSCCSTARQAARVNDRGELVTLEDQDRTRWNQTQIELARRHLEAAFAARRPASTRSRQPSLAATPPRRPRRPRTGAGSPGSTST
jgi:RNA polymerase sigma-70 factor, ECF subfamily